MTKKISKNRENEAKKEKLERLLGFLYKCDPAFGVIAFDHWFQQLALGGKSRRLERILKVRALYPEIIESFSEKIERNMEALKAVFDSGPSSSQSQKAFKLFVLNMMAKMVYKAQKINKGKPQTQEVVFPFVLRLKSRFGSKEQMVSVELYLRNKIQTFARSASKKSIDKVNKYVKLLFFS